MESFGYKLKKIRKSKKLTIAELAKLCGCSAGSLSELENDKNSPTLNTVYNLCAALNVSPSYFISDEIDENILIRKDQVVPVCEKDGSKYELLTPQGFSLRVLKVTLQPSAEFNTVSWGHDTDEVGVIVQGTMDLQQSDNFGSKQLFHLNTGDCFYQKAHINHATRCTSSTPCVVYWFFTAPRGLNPHGFNH